MPMTAHFDDTTIAQAAADGMLRAERKRLLLETRGALKSGAEASVTVHNLSETGLLIETSVELDIGESIDLVLPQVEGIRARVVWSSGPLYGCAFEAAVPQATLSAVQLRSAVQTEIGLVENPAPAGPAAVGGESFGERLHRLRKLRGLTQGELAARLGVSKPTVWAWEQDRARPIEDRIDAIAEALGVTTADLKPARSVPGLSELITRCRGQIASALETTPDKVRIMIEL